AFGDAARRLQAAQKDAPTLPESSDELKDLVRPDLPVRMDEHVKRYLEFYRSDSRGRSIMMSWLRPMGKYEALLRRTLKDRGLPTALVYVSMIESGFDPHTRSRVGAVGLWQFMPKGARIYGLRVDYWVDERKSPERATEAVVRYF